jgi:transcription elongation GreA/GreB family factor
MTGFMKRSLEARLSAVDARIESLEEQRRGDDDEATSLLAELRREQGDIVDALRDARLIDDDPFDSEAIEIGDVVTLRGAEGEVERYVLVDGKAGARARSDWVSVGAPLGAAILGRNTGDRVSVDSPTGVTECEILAFERASRDPAVLPEPAPARAAPLRLPSEAFLG